VIDLEQQVVAHAAPCLRVQERHAVRLRVAGPPYEERADGLARQQPLRLWPLNRVAVVEQVQAVVCERLQTLLHQELLHATQLRQPRVTGRLHMPNRVLDNVPTRNQRRHAVERAHYAPADSSDSDVHLGRSAILAVSSTAAHTQVQIQSAMRL
jgi:hypothetical protein